MGNCLNKPKSDAKSSGGKFRRAFARFRRKPRMVPGLLGRLGREMAWHTTLVASLGLLSRKALPQYSQPAITGEPTIYEETIEVTIETKPEKPSPSEISNAELASALLDDILLNALEKLQRRREASEVCEEIVGGLIDNAMAKIETTQMCNQIIHGILFDAAVNKIKPLKEEKVFEDLFDGAFKCLFPNYHQEGETRDYFKH